MVKKLLCSRSQFARAAGVSAAAVTKACGAVLKPSLVGKRIDVSHPAAAKYLELHATPRPESPATGIDPLYEQVVQHCYNTGIYSAKSIRKVFGIGSERATALIKMMTAAGLVPVLVIPPPPKFVPPPVTPPPAPPPVTKFVAPPPVKRGQSAVVEKKKVESLQALNEGEIIHDIPDDISAFADMPLKELIQRYGTELAFNDWLKATKTIEDINEKRLKNAASKGELISRELVRVGVIDVFNGAHLRLMTDGAKTISAGVVSKHASGMDLQAIENYVSDILGSFIKPVKSKIKRTLKKA